MSHCQNPPDEAGFQVCNGSVCTCQCDACTPMRREYAQGFDDACTIYTKAALDMARTLASMAAMLEAERVLARRRALRLRWRHDQDPLPLTDRLQCRAHWLRGHAGGLARAGLVYCLTIAGPVGRLP